MRIFIVLGLSVVLLNLGFANGVQADDSISPRGGDSDGVIPQASPWDSPSNGNPQTEEMNARAAAINNPQEIAPVMLHNAAGDIGVVNPENGKGSILQNGTFTKVICRQEDGTGGSVLTDDGKQEKIGVWHADSSKGNYEVELAES